MPDAASEIVPLTWVASAGSDLAFESVFSLEEAFRQLDAVSLDW
jgi:hypothetical protein